MDKDLILFIIYSVIGMAMIIMGGICFIKRNTKRLCMMLCAPLGAFGGCIYAYYFYALLIYLMNALRLRLDRFAYEAAAFVVIVIYLLLFFYIPKLIYKKIPD